MQQGNFGAMEDRTKKARQWGQLSAIEDKKVEMQNSS